VLFCLSILFFACSKETPLTLVNAELAVLTFNEYNPCIETVEMDQRLLPTNIQTVLENTFPNATISKVSEQNNNGQMRYDARFDNQQELLLSAEGTILIQSTAQQDAVIPINQLAAPIRSFVAAQFPGRAIEIARRMNEFNNQYIQVQLLQGGQLIFDEQFQFICANGDFATRYDDDDDDHGYGEDDDDG